LRKRQAKEKKASSKRGAMVKSGGKKPKSTVPSELRVSRSDCATEKRNPGPRCKTGTWGTQNPREERGKSTDRSDCATEFGEKVRW